MAPIAAPTTGWTHTACDGTVIRGNDRLCTGSRVSSAKAPASSASRSRNISVAFIDAGLIEGGHAEVAGERRSKHRHGKRGARALAKPHVKVEDRPHAERGAEPAMTCFRRAMRHLHMIECAWIEMRERRRRRGSDEAVEQHGDAMAAGGERGAEDAGKLTAAEDHGGGERVRMMVPVAG